MEGRKTFAALMVLIGAGNAAAQTGGWLLVRNAIDKIAVSDVDCLQLKIEMTR